MKAAWIGMLVFIWVVAAIFGSVNLQTPLLDNTTMVSPVQNMTIYATYYQQMNFGQLTNVMAHLNFFKDIWTLLILDLPLFYGSFEIIRWLILAPIIATIVYGLLQIFFSSIQPS